MRDLETISLALTAAETGHLVFGTLHASNVSSTITRILDVFPPAQKTQAQSMLAGSIRLVLSQQLLKKKEGGRIGCFEVMTGTTAIRNLIREGKMAQITSTLQTSAKEGMITMEKYLEGLLYSFPSIIMSPIQKSLLKNKNFEQIVIPNKTTHQDKSRSKINIEEIIKRRKFKIIKENKKYKIGVLFLLYFVFIFLLYSHHRNIIS